MQFICTCPFLADVSRTGGSRKPNRHSKPVAVSPPSRREDRVMRADDAWFHPLDQSSSGGWESEMEANNIYHFFVPDLSSPNLVETQTNLKHIKSTLAAKIHMQQKCGFCFHSCRPKMLLPKKSTAQVLTHVNSYS